MSAFIWLGILFCLSQSAMFSGLNLAFFGVSKLQLEIEAKNNKSALTVLRFRQDSNFLLTTVLWGNVGSNVLLALLSNSVMFGAVAFAFSTFFITFFGEIIPQAYASRHALKMASALAPIMRFYQILLYPVAKPSALILDQWLGTEVCRFFREKDLRELLKLHVGTPGGEIDQVEGTGAMNFLALDDLKIADEGESVDPKSIVQVAFADGRPVFPMIENNPSDPLLKRIQESGKKWVILVNMAGEPMLALNADGLLRALLFDKELVNPVRFCHRPIIIQNPNSLLGEAIPRLKVHPTRSDDDVIDQDIILFWSDERKRVITGSDILGRLLRGIVQKESLRTGEHTAVEPKHHLLLQGMFHRPNWRNLTDEKDLS
ncbi:MAG: DUF21 domain-containing protein [Kiritimatiellae bacterium]|nr:DUF21 domain-containing protein [Kiritimatiellia bacterium]